MSNWVVFGRGIYRSKLDPLLTQLAQVKLSTPSGPIQDRPEIILSGVQQSFTTKLFKIGPPNIQGPYRCFFYMGYYIC